MSIIETSLECVVLAGLNASGKSTVSGILKKQFGIAVVDKDDPNLCPASQKLDGLIQAYNPETDKNPFETDEYKTRLRPAIYAAMFNQASQALQAGKNVIIDSPFGTEAKDDQFLVELNKKLRGDSEVSISIHAFWIRCSEETLTKRMKKRNAKRDAAKRVSDVVWKKYIEDIDFNLAPAFPHTLIDTTEGLIEDHARTIAIQSGLITPPAPR